MNFVRGTFATATVCCLKKRHSQGEKIDEYAENQSEFVKRTDFVLMCYFAVHEKKLPDEFFYPFFEIIEKEAWDNRNFVKKAVNRALRQIGKRNTNLRENAIKTAERIKLQDTPSARWIANNALRELCPQ